MSNARTIIAKSAHSGKQSGDIDWDDDFESALVLPDGPLSLSLSSRRLGSSSSKATSGPQQQQQRRPQTALSNASASSTSGGSSIFSSSSSIDSASDNDEDERSSAHHYSLDVSGSSSSGVDGRPARASSFSDAVHHQQQRGNGKWSEKDGSKHSSQATAEDDLQLHLEGDGEGEGGDESEEKSSTIKANQLPPDFAEQLALSKAKAAEERQRAAGELRTVRQVNHLGSVVAPSDTTCDWEEDVVLDNSPRLGLHPSRILRAKASFASHISDAGSESQDMPMTTTASVSTTDTTHRPISRSSSNLSLGPNKTRPARSDTLSSRASFSDCKSNTSGYGTVADDDDFFDDLILPSYFGGRRRQTKSRETPPSSVESNLSKKVDLQALLGDKLKARAGLEQELAQAATPQQGSSSLSHKQQQAQSSTMVQHASSSTSLRRYREDSTERFEDSFVLETTASSSSQARAPFFRRTSSQLSRTQMDRPSDSGMASSSTTGRLHPGAPPSSTSSRSSSARSVATLRPSRSSMNLGQENSNHPAHAESTPSLSQSQKQTQLNNTTRPLAGRLRPRPSLSNMSTAGTAQTRPSVLARKKSIPALAELASTSSYATLPASPAASSSTSSISRSQFSSAHYAQPTRSFLARHQQLSLGSGTFGLSTVTGTGGSRPSSPAIVLNQRTDTPTAPSPSSSTGSFSRLLQPTIASRAKLRHVPSASDPSGRTSAALGMPLSPAVAAAGMSSLPSSPSVRRGLSNVAAGTSATSLENRIFRRPSQLQTFGDGSGVDGFDDLPVNREKEKTLVKVPRKRQSSGAASTGSSAGALQTRRALPLAQRPIETMQRSRTADILSRDIRSAGSRDSSLSRGKRSDSASTAASTATARPGAIGSSLTAPSAKSKQRPALKLIRNLSANGLSQVQGQMKWNAATMKWEGNESSLREFDNVMSSSARPALISPIFGPLSPRTGPTRSPLGLEDQSKSLSNGPIITPAQRALGISNPHGTTPSLGGVRVVGDMIFDPVKMTWFNTAEDGEEELNFGDDETEDTGASGRNGVDAWEGGEQLRLRTRRSFANDWSSNASSQGDGNEGEWCFDEFKRKQLDANKRHVNDMNGWFTGDTPAQTHRSHRYSHLHAIRRLVDA